MTRADLARHTGLARSTVAQRVDALLGSGLVLEAGGTASTGGRPPTALAFNHRSGVVLVADLGATHARVAISRPGRRTAGRARRGPRHRARARRGADLGVRALRRAARSDRNGGGRRARNRDRRAGPGRVPHRPAGQPSDHAGLGRLRHPGLVRGPLRRAGARRQRREHHGPRRALGPLARHLPPPAGEGRHGHRLRDRRRRAHPPRRPRRGRGHRPHPRDHRRRDLPLRERRLPRGGCRRSGARRAPHGKRSRGVQQPRRRAPGSRRQRECDAHGARRRDACSGRSSPAR